MRNSSSALTFGRDANADIHPEGLAITVEGLHGRVVTPRGSVHVESSLLGLPNLYNWMGAVGAAIVIGIPNQQIEAGIRSLQSVRGRFETVIAEGIQSQQERGGRSSRS